MGRKTEEEIRAEVERVMQELTFLEREARDRGELFVRLDEETLRRKIAGDEADSPFFGGWGMSSGPPGGTANVSVYVYNPDPVSYYYHGYRSIADRRGHAASAVHAQPVRRTQLQHESDIPDPDTPRLSARLGWLHRQLLHGRPLHA
jgi:hypothetical protein